MDFPTSFRNLSHRLRERYFEARFNVRTAEERSIHVPECRHYSPIPYRHLFAALRLMRLREDDVFFDYGCGSGRALVAAATFPIREVMGVEIDPALAMRARINLEWARGLRCRRHGVICADASEVDLPDHATLVYLYNPFFGSVLERVVTRIRASLDRRPRRLRILYFNRGDWIRATAGLPWVHSRHEFEFDYPRIGCGIYDCR